MKYVLFSAIIITICLSNVLVAQKSNPFIGMWKGTYSCYPQGEKGIMMEVKHGNSKIIITSYTYPVASNPNLPSAIIESDGYISNGKLMGENPRWIKTYRWATLNNPQPISYLKESDCLYFTACDNPVLLMRVLNDEQQTEEQFEKVPGYYDRASLTVLFLELGGENFNKVKEEITRFRFPEKYDYNNLSSLFLKPSFSRGINKYNLQEAIFHELNKRNIGKQIIEKWYDRKSDGIMNVNLVHKRGRFSVTDEHYVLAQNTTRRNAALEDYGERLINLSYILVIDLLNVKRNPAVPQQELGWQADAVGYIFKVNYTDKAKQDVYDSWINQEDSKIVRDEKNRKFETIPFPVTFVDKFVIERLHDKKNLNEDTKLQSLVGIAYREIIENAEKTIGDFKIKSPILSVKPIKAKIGVKEGIKIDDRFFVFEHILDEKTNITDVKKVGVVRATRKIADNKHEAIGNMETTKFYQVAGRKLKPGLILQQSNDIGLDFYVLKSQGEMAGLNVRFDIRVSNLVKIKSTFLTLELGFQTKNYEKALSLLGYSSSQFSFFQLEQGIAKGFQINRFSELRPYLNYGFEYTSHPEIPDDYNVGAFYLKPGMCLAINITNYFQIIGGCSYYYSSGWFTDKDENSVVPWNTIFPKRGGLAYSLGVKLTM
jgi:hypothetical protein